MKRRHSIEAEEAPARDAEVALSAALAKLAKLRRQMTPDWSDGPAMLVAIANADEAATADEAWTLALPPAPEPEAAAPAPAPVPVAHNDGLRGRLVDDPPSVDTSWIALAGPAAPPAQVQDAAATPDADEDDAARRFAGVGALAGALAFAVETGPAPPPELAAAEEEDAPLGAGAVAHVLALDLPAPLTHRPQPVRGAAVAEDADDTILIAPGALAGLATLLPVAAPPAPAVQTATPRAEAAEEDAVVLAVGAFLLDLPPLHAEAPARCAARAPVRDDDAETDALLGAGAHAALAALIDATPPPLAAAVTIRAFDPASLVDDALADAFESLMCAHDPLESAWGADTLTLIDDTTAACLAHCEAALWNLPRHVPCIETFLATPNHETAVKLTRALRLRATALEARAFAEGVDFGFLHDDSDAAAFWFMADALSDATSLCAGDAAVEASFPDWEMSPAGLIVVTAPDLVRPHPVKAPPLITEAELDALFTHVDDARAHILDDLGEDAQWSEPYWSDVDAYLATETGPYNGSDDFLSAAPYDPAHDIHDIEVRDMAPPAPATHFWMPGDPADLAIDGEGDDLFIVGAADDAAVVLVEDGATHAMRTGHPARIDELVVSLSHDRWRDVDAMRWTRLAVLAGVAQVRIEQNAAGARRAVREGAFFATALEDDGVRLVRSGDDGEQEFPVIRLGEPAGAAWPFADLAGAEAPAYAI